VISTPNLAAILFDALPAPPRPMPVAELPPALRTMLSNVRIPDSPDPGPSDAPVRQPDIAPPRPAPDRTAQDVARAVDERERREAEEARALTAQIRAEAEDFAREHARRSFPEFARQAINSGFVHGIRRVQWAPHLELLCTEIQHLLEGWLVATGSALPDADGRGGLGVFGREMVARQDALWARHGLVRLPGHVLVQNEVINICPGTLKSTILCVLANAWIWLHAPWFVFGCASYNEKNVDRDANATRALVVSKWYRDTFDIRWVISPVANAVRHFQIVYPTGTDAAALGLPPAGGERYSRTTGQGFTGLHLNGMFLDDPDDADRVWNDPEREGIHNKWSNAMENRVTSEDYDLRVILQQRVHVDDLSGYVLGIVQWSKHKRKGWAWLCIPLQYGRGPKDAPTETPFGGRDWRTKIDEVMHAERFSAEVIADKITKLFEQGFGAQYNQNPQPLDAGMFLRSSLRWFVVDGTEQSAPGYVWPRRRPDGCAARDGEGAVPPVVLGLKSSKPDLDFVSISVDPSNGGESLTASNVGLVVVGGKDERRYWLDDRSRVMGIQEMYDEIEKCVCDWAHLASRVLVEIKAAGSSVVNELKKLLESGKLLDKFGAKVRIEVTEIKVASHDNYIIRARGMVPTINGGLLYILDGAGWLWPKMHEGKTLDDGAIGELCGFPHARRDDRVDALAHLINYYRSEGAAAARAKALNVW
jgi:phage terminase large subunit-like protein